MKIAFIKRKRFSHINASLRAQLERCFPDYEIEELDVFRDFIVRRPDVVVRNVFAILASYGRDILRGRRKLNLCFYRTPYIFHAIRRFLRARYAPRLADYAFSFATQSLYDASIPGLPHFIYTDHTHLANRDYPDFPPDGFFSREWIDLEREIYLHARRVFVPGENTQRSLIKHYGCEPGRALCVYAGSNFQSSAPPPLANDGYRNQTIAFVGIDWERKGGPELVTAFHHVLDRLPKARLIIIGASPAISHPRIEIAGRLPVAEVQQRLTRASLLCLPSRIEPFGIAVIEGFSLKLPVIVTRVGALPGLVRDHETGRVVEPQNPAALADALIDLLSDPAKSRRCGEAGYRFMMENCTWDAVGNKIRREIETALRRPAETA